MNGRAWILILLAAAAIAAVFGSSALRGTGAPAGRRVWSGYQNGPAHNAVTSAGSIRVNWLTKLDEKINGGLAVLDGTVYVDSFDRGLYALDERTGDVRWSAHADNILMSTPVVTSEGLVIVGSGKDGFLKPDDANSQVWGRPQGDDLYAFSTANGRLVWKFHTAGQDMPSPALHGGDIVFANGDAHAYALDVRSARLRWKVALPGVATMASTTVDAGMAFVSTCHNAPYVCETRALNADTGQTAWTNPNGGSDCTPTVDRGLVFVNSTTNDDRQFHTGGATTVAAIDERSGRTRWRRTFPAAPFTYIASSERQIAGTAHNGVLYQPIGNLGRVVAMDERTGRIIWTARTSGNVKMSPLIAGRRVYFGDTEGIFYVVDRGSGRTLHTTSFLQPFSVSPPVIDGKTLFVANGMFVTAMPVDSL